MMHPTPRARKALGERIRNRRLELRLRQRDVAASLETLLEEVVSQGIMSKIEFGNRDVTPRELEAIAVVLECEVADLDPDGDSVTDTPSRVVRGGRTQVRKSRTTEPPSLIALWELLGYMTEKYPEGALRIGENQWLRYRVVGEAP